MTFSNARHSTDTAIHDAACIETRRLPSQLDRHKRIGTKVKNALQRSADHATSAIDLNDVGDDTSEVELPMTEGRKVLGKELPLASFASRADLEASKYPRGGPFPHGSGELRQAALDDAVHVAEGEPAIAPGGVDFYTITRPEVEILQSQEENRPLASEALLAVDRGAKAPVMKSTTPKPRSP
ncbi:hypothetical protein NEOLEDRAFT_1151586 [Neolentinus lepideus HHB14362 ss-1]|uniref:Uncharacterized protein n=1 Tax=Neolentinus lepideus HHB14362 ss-1 TaxID=1314782 RepID=A0A165NS03_9AGAM|nr:hypothetical protein NEOLEDRAFT_1151586 [Neolentinus lepideus HHB14362 ss-1]